MGKINNFVDPDYDRKLLEFKARRDRLRKEQEEKKEDKNEWPRR